MPVVLPPFTPHFATLARGYDVALCDVWGVVHNGAAATSEACDALARFRKQGGTVVLITNAPRRRGTRVPRGDACGAVPRAAAQWPEACGARPRARQQGGPVVLTPAAPRPGERVARPTPDGLGLPRPAYAGMGGARHAKPVE